MCSQHKTNGMVRIYTPTCDHGGCDTIASYGYPGERPIYCYRHSVDGTTQLRKKKCTHPSCARNAYYGDGGKATFCRRHATDGMTGPGGERISTTASPAPAGPSATAPTLAAAPLPTAVMRDGIVGRASALFVAHYNGLGAEGGTSPGDECSTDDGDGIRTSPEQDGGADCSSGVDGVQQPVMEATFICAGARGQTNASNLHVLVAAAATAGGDWESDSGGCFDYSGGGSFTGSDDEMADDADQV